MKNIVKELSADLFESVDFECECGNTSADSGFYPCDEFGEIIEPGLDWCGYYVCVNCGMNYLIK